MSFPGRLSSFWERGHRSWVGSARGSLTGLPHPEAQLEDGGNRRDTGDPSSRKVPLSLNGLPAPQAPVELPPRKLPTPFSSSAQMLEEGRWFQPEESSWPWPSGIRYVKLS